MSIATELAKLVKVFREWPHKAPDDFCIEIEYETITGGSIIKSVSKTAKEIEDAIKAGKHISASLHHILDYTVSGHDYNANNWYKGNVYANLTDGNLSIVDIYFGSLYDVGNYDNVGYGEFEYIHVQYKEATGWVIIDDLDLTVEGSVF